LVTAITGASGGGFSPISLFSASDKGYIYDNNDLSSFYLDSAGTTPATVNGLVGLQLDKSQARGNESCTDPTLDTPASWIVENDTAAIVISGGVATIIATATSSMARNGSVAYITNGKTYEVIYNVGSYSGTFGPRLAVVAQTGVGGGTFNTSDYIQSAGQKRWQFTATGTGVIAINRVSGHTGTSTITDISVRELPGNHRFQTTTGSKPILRGTPVGSSLVTNGDFASGTGWTAGSGWAIGSGVATATASSGTLTSTLTATASKFYRVTYTVTRTAGSVQVSFGGRSGISRSASGTYVDYLDNTLNTNALVLTGTTFDGTVDNIEVVDVSDGAVTAPYGLQYDGIDDFLTTASVDFTATDKMAVVMGVRKLSDSAYSTIAELSLSNDAVGDAFAVFGANTSGYYLQTGAPPNRTYGVVSGGTAAPVTNVIAALFDRAQTDASEARLKTNGGSAVNAPTVEGTSASGNFGNHVLYFGRRGGTSLPFNGLDFGGGCINKTLTATQLSQFERWVAQRTGVVL
jgi:hypothetical protein